MEMGFTKPYYLFHAFILVSLYYARTRGALEISRETLCLKGRW